MNQFREDLEAAVKEQNFERAGEIKTTIAQLDAEKNQLLATSEPVREEVRTEKVSFGTPGHLTQVFHMRCWVRYNIAF